MSRGLARGLATPALPAAGAAPPTASRSWPRTAARPSRCPPPPPGFAGYARRASGREIEPKYVICKPTDTSSVPFPDHETLTIFRSLHELICSSHWALPTDSKSTPMLKCVFVWGRTHLGIWSELNDDRGLSFHTIFTQRFRSGKIKGRPKMVNFIL